MQGEISTVERSSLRVLALTALGVVYGDIGTSPLYAVRECFFGEHGVPINPGNILGVLSLIFWSLVIVVTVKYHVYVLRADNHGEGGILALMALVRGAVSGRRRWLVVAIGIFGAALLYGDGIITPAISVLGAIEGLDVATPVFRPYVVPLSAGILVGLFLFQRRGTAGVGSVFGPVMLLWFGTLAVLGATWIAREPSVLRAVDPRHAVAFFAANGFTGFLVLGAVFLVATGGEALYADLGHFGERPIQIDWFCLVGPALLTNYFGQGALLLSRPEAAHNPFYRMAPSWALYPLVVLATAAAIIASQAIISGAFSLTRQAVQLGLLPRVDIIHTSSSEIGQIYIPGVNWLLMVFTIALVIGFGSSSNLASAYGVAVTTTMVITTALAAIVTHRLWHWPLWLTVLVTAVFLFVDLSFFGSNAFKVEAGGWFPLVIGALVFAVMATWRRGRRLVAAKLAARILSIEDFQRSVEARPVHRVRGTAVYLTGSPEGTPIALLHNFKLNQVLHEQNVFLTVVSEEVPYVPAKERLKLEALGQGFFRAIARYGFMEDPNIPAVLRRAEAQGLELDPAKTTYVLSRNALVAAAKPEMATWREKLFMFMANNSQRATSFFRLPPNRVVELGMQIEL